MYVKGPSTNATPKLYHQINTSASDDQIYFGSAGGCYEITDPAPEYL